MIIFDLKCQPQGHVFEAWFGSSDDFQSQSNRGLVQCPICGSEAVEKAPMAPRVGMNADRGTGLAADAMKAMLARMATAQKSLLEKSDFVGDRFPDEARAIHLGEAEARSIHGRASPSDAASLIDEGIQVAPLPFPVAAPGEEN